MCLVCNANLTFMSKPEFVDRMIEVGSYHFLRSFADLNLAAAEAEIGEHIGDFDQSAHHARRSLWHLRKTVELYDALVNSISDFEVADSAREILSEFNYDEFHQNVVRDGFVIDESRQWEELTGVARRVDPVGALRLFTDKVRDVEPILSRVSEGLKTGEMEPQDIHRAMTALINALLVGQYIAQFNRTTRQAYAKA